MSRYPKLQPEAWTPEQRAVAEAMLAGPRGSITTPFQPLLYAPATADAVQNFGEHIRFGVSLSDEVKELVHILTARFWGAQAEWWAHSRRAIREGFDPAKIDQIERGEHPTGFSDEQETIYAFCAEIHLNHAIGDGTYRKLIALYGQSGVMELVAVCGYYTMMGMVFNVAEIPLPEGATALPPTAGLKR